MFKRRKHTFEIDVSDRETVEIRRKDMSDSVIDRIDLFEMADEIRDISNQLDVFYNIFGLIHREFDLESEYPELKEEADIYENKLREIFLVHNEELEKLKNNYLKAVEQCKTMEKIKKNT